MKVRIEIDDQLTEKEIVIKAPSYDPEVQNLYRIIQNQTEQTQSLVFYKDNSEFFLDFDSVLFFETDDRQVHAHTTDDDYQIHFRLYELENKLPDQFIRISKSAIINLNNIFSLTRSVSGTLVKFQNSHKQVYVSRRYYKQLKDRLQRRG